MDGVVQVDETYVGGRNANKAKPKQEKGTQGRSTKSKTVVFGLLSDGQVKTEIVPNTRGRTLKGVINDTVEEGSTVVSDGWVGYKGLHRMYQHRVIDHSKGSFMQDGYHTNSIEGFWSLLKRGIFGIYHVASAKHLQLYCDEFAYRYNTRHMPDGVRFILSLQGATHRLQYQELTA
ncbi:hypothetical protein GCM10009117_09000 [Gangjinia marincola]|uniref:ISXO2-like transposase domain-containing protein n=2 Tax=Gangjinia marincola TaxID=578463 RepID=A0ABP3XTT0_9FLAO